VVVVWYVVVVPVIVSVLGKVGGCPQSTADIHKFTMRDSQNVGAREDNKEYENETN
jgi:hypothetical protein